MIDFHCHLDLYPNAPAVVRECRGRGIYVLSVTTTPSAWRGSSKLVATAPRVRLALGLHPLLARERKFELPLLEELLAEARYVGEIGLDGSDEGKAQWDDQILVFETILRACATAGGRVMSIHSRRAARQVLQYLSSYPSAGTPILHWFSGSDRELDAAVELGCWFSVGPAMLASAKGRKLTARMPRDRVLTESDGPFAQTSGRSCLPWDVESASSTLAELWGLGLDATQQVLHDNLRRLVTIAA